MKPVVQGLKILLAAFIIYTLFRFCTSLEIAESVKPLPLESLPKTDKTVAFTFRNASPVLLRVAINVNDQIYETYIEPCDKCRMYFRDVDIPEKCPVYSVAKTVQISPGSYELEVNFVGDSIRNVAGFLEVQEASQQGTCYYATKGVN